MSATIVLWMRAELQAHWRAWLGLGLILGIAGGAVIAAAAAARRTDTAYDRFLVAQNAADVAMFDDGFLGITVDLDAVSRLPQVAEVARAGLAFYTIGNHVSLASVDDRLGRTINRFRVLEGRMYDSTKVDEVVVGFGVARRENLHVGSSFDLIPVEAFDSACHGDTECLASLAEAQVTFTVVGIVAGPGEFPPQFVGSYPSIHMTPAFFRKVGNIFTSENVGPERGTLFIRLKRGAADLPAFREAFAKLAPGQLEFISSAEETGSFAKRAFHFQALALWLLAAFGAVAVVLVAGQALARQAFLGSSEFPTLRALGVGRRQLMTVGLARAALIGLVGAGIALGLGAALSPLAPIGDARFAEPNPGVSFDALALALGAACVLAWAILASALPAWRGARVAGALGFAARQQPVRLAAAAVRTGMPASAVAGIRLALEPGRGRTAVPVRSTIASLVVGIAVLCGALTFGASLGHLLDTPELYGVRWDTRLTTYGSGPDLRDNLEELKAITGLAGLTIGGDTMPAEIGGLGTPVMAIMPLRGEAYPPIVEGELPNEDHEIALTAPTFRRLRTRLGGSISVRAPVTDAEAVTFTVVGRTVIAPSGTSIAEGGPGEGALINLDGLTRLAAGIKNPQITKATALLVRFSSGVDRRAVLDAIEPLMGLPEGDPGITDEKPETPADIVSFGRVQNLPLLLGIILGLVATTTLAHTIASSVRRRRADHAILKTLGFTRGQVSSTVAWQATVLAAVALLIGVPGGVMLGGWLWTLFAEQLGIAPESRVNAVQTVLLVPAAFALANAIAMVPARAAARLRPARVLRSE